MVICLERSANDLHMIRLMPLPFYHLCFNKIQLVYPSGTDLYSDSPGKKAVKQLCVCLYSVLPNLKGIHISSTVYVGKGLAVLQ